MTPTDGRAAHRKASFGLRNALPRLVEGFASFPELAALRKDVVRRAFFVALDLLDVGTPHLDFLEKRLHIEHRIIALQAQLVATQRHIGFVGTCILLFQTGHQRSGLIEVGKPLQLLLHELLALRERLDGGRSQGIFLLLRGEFVVAEVVLHDFLQIARQDFNALLGLDRLLMDGAGDLSVDFSSRQFLQQGRLLAAPSTEEIRKTILRQHDGARKLRIIQSDDFRNAAVDFRLRNGFLVGREALQATHHLVVVVRSFKPQSPFCLIAFPRSGGKLHSGEGFAAAATENAPHVGRRNGLCAVGIFLHVVARDALRIFKTRRVVVERQTNGIENGRFARPRVARDGEEPSRAQRLLREVDNLFSLN